MKFFTVIFFIIISYSCSIGQGVHLYNQKKGKKIKVSTQQRIEFTLYSDSTLQFNYVDEGNIVSYTDSSIVMNSDREVLLSDFKSITIFPKNSHKAKSFSISFLFAGISFLTKGIIMAAGEGLKSKNKETAPLFIAGGGIVTAIASIPFLGRKKTFHLNNVQWQLIFL